LKHYVSLRDALQASISYNPKVGVHRTKPSRDTAAQHVLKNTSEYIYISDGEDEDYTPSNLRKGAKNCARGSEPYPAHLKIKGKAVRVEIAHIPKDDVDVVSFHLRFLRQLWILTKSRRTNGVNNTKESPVVKNKEDIGGDRSDGKRGRDL